MNKMISVKFTVTTDGCSFYPEADSIITQYELSVEDTPKSIRENYEESRQVWSEYYVICETPQTTFSASHTYADQLAAEAEFGESDNSVDVL